MHYILQVPLVPLVPYLSVCMNVYLMVQLDYQTWVRFIIWLVIGKSLNSSPVNLLVQELESAFGQFFFSLL